MRNTSRVKSNEHHWGSGNLRSAALGPRGSKRCRHRNTEPCGYRKDQTEAYPDLRTLEPLSGKLCAVYIYIYIYERLAEYGWKPRRCIYNTCISLSLSLCVHIYIYITCVCIYTYIYIYICMYVCIYKHVDTYIYIYIYHSMICYDIGFRV